MVAGTLGNKVRGDQLNPSTARDLCEKDKAQDSAPRQWSTRGAISVQIIIKN